MTTTEIDEGQPPGPPEETTEAAREKSPLRLYHDTQVSAERFRIGVGNRISAFDRGVDEAERPVPEVYERVHKLAVTIEEEIDKAIAAELKRSWPIYNEWLSHVKGIGPSLAGQLLALLLPPIPGKGPSSWYKAAGLAPEMRPDGLSRLPRPRRGEGKVTYHPYLRRCLYNVATSFVRSGGYYRTAYEQVKARLQAQHAGDEHWAPHRIESTARWRTVKLFLAHLWEAWCELEGIPRRPPYAIEYAGHSTYIPRPMPADHKGKM